MSTKDYKETNFRCLRYFRWLLSSSCNGMNDNNLEIVIKTMSVLIKKYTTAFNFKLNIKYNVISLHCIEFYLIFNSICKLS